MALKESQLEALLNYRKNLETQAKLAYAEAQRNEEKVKSELLKAEQERQRVIRDIESRQKEGIKIHELITMETGLSVIEDNISTIRRNIVEAQQNTRKAQQILDQAMKERKVMDTLKEKHDLAKAKELKQREQKLLDEISIQNHGKKP